MTIGVVPTANDGNVHVRVGEPAIVDVAHDIVGDAKCMTVFAGNVMVAVIFVAGAGPLFVMRSVKIACPPGATGISCGMHPFGGVGQMMLFC